MKRGAISKVLISHKNGLGMSEMLEDFIKSAANFAGLKSLIFSRCPINLGQGGRCAAPCDLLLNLEELQFQIKEITTVLGLCLQALLKQIIPFRKLH
ncbi:hypothetical protein CFP56_008253 [Quercus suber]|uniref:Uncharacterized protein n=1 Tax=Quercus suber TaxID=58331 RepID=A0AAW0L3E0_QUESU